METKIIKNLVFDFGGILVGLDKHRCIAALDSIGAYEISVYVDECRQEDLFHDLEMGHISVPGSSAMKCAASLHDVTPPMNR